jgi:hypothetical protein
MKRYFLFVVMLFFISSLGFAEELTFEKTKTPKKYATGFKLEKGWQKKVTIKDVKIQGALPRNFDWREQGKILGTPLTPIRDQGNCGSCWSFATSEVLQDAMALHGKGQIAVSTQYLLSCNNEGYSCDGGFFAHKYHMALPMGGVPESEFPYVAKQVACKANLSHLYHLSSWAYLPSKDEGTPPTNDQIKSAIYQYGPIAAGVGANDAMQSYSSGIFNGCDGTSPNHAISIVGWNDDGQYWIVRNSWSAAWGEQGWINIKYGCNSIGISANYVVFDGSSPAPGPTPKPGPSPTPVPPSPTPVPKCTPQPYANAGKDVMIRRGQQVTLGTPAKPGTSYHWESSAGRGRPLDTAIITVTPYVSQIFTVYAHTKCGTAKSSAMVILK